MTHERAEMAGPDRPIRLRVEFGKIRDPFRDRGNRRDRRRRKISVGFVEPGESIEEAARRETLEEAGIVCSEVKYFRSQPWPFPMSLMIGCHARAANSNITVDREELEDARWFSRDETALMFIGRHPEGISIPPPMAIAHHIIRAWVEEGDGVFA